MAIHDSRSSRFDWGLTAAGMSRHSPTPNGNARVTGFEPATELDSTALPESSCEIKQSPCAALALQTSVTECRWVPAFDCNLQIVIKMWSGMPDEMRQAVLAIANATSALRPEIAFVPARP
jgi:hypothetical protein